MSTPPRKDQSKAQGSRTSPQKGGKGQQASRPSSLSTGSHDNRSRPPSTSSTDGGRTPKGSKKGSASSRCVEREEGSVPTTVYCDSFTAELGRLIAITSWGQRGFLAVGILPAAGFL